MFYIIDLRGRKLRLLASVILICIIIYDYINFFVLFVSHKYADLVTKYSEKYNLILIWCFQSFGLSKFNPQATSHKGARDLQDY